MTSTFFSFSLSHQTAALFEGADRLRSWWLQEFFALFPEKAAEWLAGQQRSLVIESNADAVTFILLGDRRKILDSQHLNHTEFAASAIDDFLGKNELRRQDVSIGLRLPPARFFHRTLVLPIEVSAHLHETAIQDLVRKTPFRLPDIFHGYTTSRTATPGKITVWQWVVRRDFIAGALSKLSLSTADVSFVDAGQSADENSPSPFVSLNAKGNGKRSWAQRVLLTLTLSALLLALVAAGLTYWRQQTVLDELEVQVATAKAQAQKVRVQIDDVEQRQAVFSRLRAKKRNAPGLLDVWEEATRVLPSHSWLTDLQILEATDRQPQQITMTGLSAAAASLVGLIDQSPLFTDTTLTAPIAVDQAEGRERFSLQAKIKAQRPPEVAQK
ncbi:MAG TPA: PilN domain-containing protein [Xanthobacteraceae bacterium]|jgi:general secretion pathway protein L|nr:PilN domain-containing protein [Xanthobacteraceae bacterium]